ncbi:MAG TPA: hypothetical protein VLC10_02430 [Patescibacteria group bacterium]|nr:hypothetical protein [Patescibacteria group bacterium]
MSTETAYAVDREDGTIVIEGTARRSPSVDAALVRLGLIPDFAGELRKTGEERRAIDATFATLSALRGELGLAPQTLDPDAVHVFGDQDFWKRWGSERRAFTQFGHVYLARRFLFLYFLQDVTHEIIHASALRATIDPSRNAEGAIRYVRSGFSPLDGRPDTKRWRFVGFNEGVTELIAMAIRARMAETARSLLSEDMTRVFLGECLYPTFVLLVDDLLEAAAAGGSAEAARDALFADYFERSSGFLKSLARKMPGVLGTLATVESGRDALAAAERLGFAKAAAAIRRRLMRRRRR